MINSLRENRLLNKFSLQPNPREKKERKWTAKVKKGPQIDIVYALQKYALNLSLSGRTPTDLKIMFILTRIVGKIYKRGIGLCV